MSQFGVHCKCLQPCHQGGSNCQLLACFIFCTSSVPSPVLSTCTHFFHCQRRIHSLSIALDTPKYATIQAHHPKYATMQAHERKTCCSMVYFILNHIYHTILHGSNNWILALLAWCIPRTLWFKRLPVKSAKKRLNVCRHPDIQLCWHDGWLA